MILLAFIVALPIVPFILLVNVYNARNIARIQEEGVRQQWMIILKRMHEDSGHRRAQIEGDDMMRDFLDGPEGSEE